MKYIILLPLLFLISCTTTPKSSIRTSTRICKDFTKPQPILPGHYWDHKIHLVPHFIGSKDSLTSEQFDGYVVVYIPPKSPFHKKGVLVGDLILEVDGIKPKYVNLEDNPEFLSKIASVSFNNIQLEHCKKKI